MLLLVVAITWLWPPSAAERRAWLEDFDRLEAHTGAAYANLADRLVSRSLSPRELDRRARAALAGARSLAAARGAVEEFVGAFDDGHFRTQAAYGPLRRWLRRIVGKDRAAAAGPIPRGASGDEACARFGARDRRAGPLDWASLPGFEALAGDAVSHPFPAGLLRRPGAAPLGILRVGLFSPSGHPQLCAAEWERFDAERPDRQGDCDDACQEAFWRRLNEAFLDRFAAELTEIAAAGAPALLLDLTGNGGGSGIVGPMTRMLTSAPPVARDFGFIRHPHWVAQLTAMSAELDAELARPELPARQREIVASARARVEAARRQAESPCDLSGLWSLASAAELPCSNLGRTGPWLDPALGVRPEELEGLEIRGLLGAGDPGARTGVWRGALWIVVDERTASASEDLVASLQDAGAARVVGERTMGVGCGFTDGGVKLELPALGMTIEAPDCVRYRADGRNEAEGVLPDRPVDWRAGDDARARAGKAIAALAGAAL